MKVLSAVKIFYIFYSIYTLFVVLVSNYRLEHAAFGVAAAWIVFFAYSLGFQSVKHKRAGTADTPERSGSPKSNVYEWKKGTYFFHAALCWACSILAAVYYTGLWPAQVFNHLRAGNSLYALYQQHFRSQGISSFGLAKIPFILMLTYVTILLFVSFLGIMSSGKKPKLKHYAFLISVALSYYYFGVSRGTNFEMYIIFVLLAYCLLCRDSVREKRAKSKKKRYSGLIMVAIFGVIAVGIFRIVLTARGSVFENGICPEIQYDPNSLFARLFPAFTNIGLSVFSYLGYGIYAIGATVADVIFRSSRNALAALFPMSYELFLGRSLTEALFEIVDVGVHWIPDWITFTGLLGLPLLLILMYLLGKFTSRCYVIKRPRLLQNLICSLSFLFMLSIPVGNFIFTSTPNVLLIAFVFIWDTFFRRIHVSFKR